VVEEKQLQSKFKSEMVPLRRTLSRDLIGWKSWGKKESESV